jgi:hypothetical protein
MALSTAGRISLATWNEWLPASHNAGHRKGGDHERKHPTFDSSLDSHHRQHSDIRLHF